MLPKYDVNKPEAHGKTIRLLTAYYLSVDVTETFSYPCCVKHAILDRQQICMLMKGILSTCFILEKTGTKLLVHSTFIFALRNGEKLK